MRQPQAGAVQPVEIRLTTMDPSLPALLVLLAPSLAAIVILRPSWPEFLLLVSPLIVASSLFRVGDVTGSA